jgi:hypothetical protein
MLEHASAGRFMVVPRTAVARAEAQLGWRSGDVLHFDRLQTLGHAVNADQLIVGWIPLFVVEVGGGKTMPPNGGGPPMALANVVVQVFNVAQGRLISEIRQSGFALAANNTLLTEWALRRALQPAVVPLLATLTSPAP